MIKMKKRLIGTGLVLATGILLSACGQFNTNTSTYSSTFSANPTTFNYLLDYYADNTAVITNLVDGLLENDSYGNLVPALAEDWSVSSDGLTYTYKLRKDAKWYTADGEEYASVKAQDFVTGIKYAADNKGQAMDLIQNSIKGLDDYVTGVTNDFSTVGVKALDDYTVEYTLTRPEPYWNSKTTNSILFPVNEEFLKSKDKDFGTLTPDSILYNGPYLLKDFTSKSSIEYVKNPHYYDHDKVTIEKVKLAYFDGSDQEMTIRNFENGAYSIAGVYPNSSNYAKTKEKYQDNIVYSLQDKTSWYFNFNVNRKTYNHTAKTTDEQKKSTQTAILNKNFRQAINFGIDRTAYSAQSNGEEAASKTLRNTLVPPTFVQVGDKTFGEVTASKLVNYGTEWSGINLADAQDGLYNPDKAKAEFAKAKTALQAEGVKFPIHLDMPVDQTNTTKVQRVQSFKQSVEENLGSDNVVIDIQQLQKDDVQNITYFAETAAGEDWDISDNVGWSPDYIDPSTYLDIIKPSVGENTKTYLGFDSGTNNAAAKQVGLEDYEKMVVEAGEETTDVSKRYEKYAAAQAWLTDSALLIPTTSQTGRPMLSKMVPFTLPFAYSGNKGMSEALLYKYLDVQDKAVTTEEYQKAQENWLKEKEESNKKAQEDLANHVK